jgi:hypothetical protein
VAPSLTRGRVYNLLLLLGPASAVPLGSDSRGTQDHIFLAQFFRLSQPGGPGPRTYILQEQGSPVIPPGTGFPFRRLLQLAGPKVKVKLRPTISRPVRLGVRLLSGIRDQFFFILEIFFRQLQVCYFVSHSLTRGRVCNLLLLLVLASAIPLGSTLSDER